MDSKEVSAHSVLEMPGAGDRDQRDMARLGRVQQLKRQFGPLAMIGFAIVLASSWQAVLVTLLVSLPNGGPAGAIITYLITATGFIFTCISLAELSSIAPTAGGQYHWVSELAPANYQKFLSYMTGYTACFAWHVLVVTTSNAKMEAVQGIVALYRPGFHFTSWQQGLAVIALIGVEALVNTALLDYLPSLEFIMLALGVCLWIAFEIVMLLLGPRLSAEDVFTNFENLYNWPTTGTAVMVGMLAATASLATVDSVVHMAEELKDASRWLPRTLIIGSIWNYVAGFLMLLTILFRAVNIPEALKANPLPWIAIVNNITKSKAGTTVLALALFVTVFFGTVNMLSTASRQVFALGRDRALPFGEQLQKVTPKGVPYNAIITSMCFVIFLTCCLMGSAIAFKVVLSLGAAFVLTSYMLTIGTVLLRRIHTPLPPAPFSLGRWGIPINIVALCWSSFAFVIMFFPPAPNPTLAQMNWTCVIFGGLEGLAIVLYFARQKNIYVPPVNRVKDVDRMSPMELERYKQ